MAGTTSERSSNVGREPLDAETEDGKVLGLVSSAWFFIVGCSSYQGAADKFVPIQERSPRLVSGDGVGGLGEQPWGCEHDRHSQHRPQSFLDGNKFIA